MRTRQRSSFMSVWPAAAMISIVPSLVPFDHAAKSPPRSIDWMFPASIALSTTDVSALANRGEVFVTRTDGALPVLTAGCCSSSLVAFAGCLGQ